MQLGTEAHQQLFCHSSIDTYLADDVHQLPWPELNADQLQVLRGLPFWGKALKVETMAGELLRSRLMPTLFSSIPLGWQLGSPARLRQRVSA